jgi:hypothetical protein
MVDDEWKINFALQAASYKLKAQSQKRKAKRYKLKTGPIT